MPVLPHLVTEYATVRKSLKLSKCHANIFRQRHLSYCNRCNDEEPDNFKDLFPMLGTFHMAYVLLQCAGRYITGSGVDDALIEGPVFGETAILSVLSGGHYIRSFQGMLIMAAALSTLAWQVFSA